MYALYMFIYGTEHLVMVGNKNIYNKFSAHDVFLVILFTRINSALTYTRY